MRVTPGVPINLSVLKIYVPKSPYSYTRVTSHKPVLCDLPVPPSVTEVGISSPTEALSTAQASRLHSHVIRAHSNPSDVTANLSVVVHMR